MGTEDENFLLKVTEGNSIKITKGTQTQVNQNGKWSKEFHINLKDLGVLLNYESGIHHRVDVDGNNPLNLNGSTIKDSLHIFWKVGLRELYLSDLSLKTVPVCLFSGLDALKILDISFNNISNFDIEPRCRTSLKDLRLNNNQLTNVPEWILALRAPNLEDLDYSFNKMNDLKCIFNKYDLKLTRLKMQNCYLLDQDLKFFKNIKSLESLDISNKQGDSIGSNYFEDLDKLFVEPKWKNLKVLKLDNLSLSVIPKGITWLESLSELHLTNNHLSWLPDGMEYLVNLEVIDVSNNTLSYFPAGFFLLQYLRVLKAANNQLADFKDVTSMLYLEVLDLYDNELEIMSNFPPAVKFVDVDLNYFETEHHFNKDYITKREEYRMSLLDARLCGPKVRYVKSDPWENDSTSSSDSSLPDDILDVQLLEENMKIDEDWDEPYLHGKVKHPDITFSDDEWDGSISSPSPQLLSTTLTADRVYNDDWMFCDAEEEGSSVYGPCS